MTDHILHLTNEATDWENATPVGCGSLGAMLYGGVDEERLQLNEEHIWAEASHDIDTSDFRARFLTVRDALLQGKNADALAKELLDPYFGRVGSYETAGELHLLLHHTRDIPTDYCRNLDLMQGVATVAYTKGSIRYRRTLLASHPRRAIVMHLEADHPAAISFTASYHRKSGITVTASDDLMTVHGKTACGKHSFTVKLRFLPVGGTLQAHADGTLSLTSADSVTICITAATDAEAPLPDALPYQELLAEHTADFSAIMRRAAIVYDSDPAVDALPIPARLQRIKDGATDTGLINLYFQFGRYLLLSSSRQDSLPANLQGVWNGAIHAPWNADYHTNVNLQMNYWHAELANLPECALPLFRYMNDYLLEGGKTVARDYYGCRGTVVHHLSDIYGFASPADGLWGLWQVGGAWLCYAMWEHYLFSPDLDFLRDTAYPYIKESALFFLDFMFTGSDGKLHTGPSTSPENTYFVTENGVRTAAHLCLSPTMDIAIVRGLLQMYIATEELLGIDQEQLSRAKAAYQKLPAYQIGARGQLMEWQQDYDEPEPGHRHISHAFPLYPGWEINRNTPALMQAIDNTLRERLSHGGGHTGWSCAWLINLYARLGQGDRAADMIAKLLRNSTLDNLFDTHPPFQIDGNFGATAAMAEMLLQSHTDTLDLLPALPHDPAYQSGSFYGLRGRGGITVDATWHDGHVTSCTLLCAYDTTVRLRVNDTVLPVPLQAGKKQDLVF